ncbi:hypothetical protein D0Y65_020413 [Glycine soja]|uniref:Uncharacterized protein n=1 Tax=Glycine soja TaxID=3848 RepID=A0A445JDY5_GLYSO|nr:hypothetical protein D0Y65_020413 [Glycine soja]
MLLSPDHSLVRASLAFSVPFSLGSSVIELFSLDHVVHGLPCVKLHTINTLVRYLGENVYF